MKLSRIINDLQKRNVFKAAASYIIFSWVILQVADTIYPSFGWEQQAMDATLILLITGLPVWLIFAYIFEWTPEGFKKTEDVKDEESLRPVNNRKLNQTIIAGLLVAVVLLVADKVFQVTGKSTLEEIDKSVAVLAFSDMSAEKDQGYFSDGISEEILNLLAKVPELKVTSRTSSFSYKGKDLDLKRIGRELEVEYILEGSIRKAGNTFRITAQLIRVNDDRHLWSETFDRDMIDIFKVQDEISQKVSQQLKVSILGEQFSLPTTDPKAYEIYLLARESHSQRTPESSKEAERLVNESLKIDSTYAPSWELLSNIYFSQANIFVNKPMEEARKKGKAAAKRSVELDPTYARAYNSLAAYNQWDREFDEMIQNSRKAIELAPSDGNILRRAGFRFSCIGKEEIHEELVARAIDVDPLSYFLYSIQATINIQNQDFDNAKKNRDTFAMKYPNRARLLDTRIQLGLGEYDSAYAIIKDMDIYMTSDELKYKIQFKKGDSQKADSIFTFILEKYGEIAWPNIAELYAIQGDKDNAFKMLNTSIEQKDFSLFMILAEGDFQNLYGDPRWNEFINRTGLPKNHGFHMD